MRSLKSFLERSREDRQMSYIDFLEEYIIKIGGKVSKDELFDEYFTLQTGRSIMKKPSPSQKSESASTSSPTLPLTDTGT